MNKKIILAVIIIGGQKYIGRSHFEAINKYVDAGNPLEFDVDFEGFQVGSELINRTQAMARFGADQSEALCH